MYPRHHQISMSDQKEKMEEKLNEDSLLKKYLRIFAVVTAYW